MGKEKSDTENVENYSETVELQGYLTFYRAFQLNNSILREYSHFLVKRLFAVLYKFWSLVEIIIYLINIKHS